MDNFSAPDDTSKEDGDNGGHNDTKGMRRERKSAARAKERAPISEKNVPLEELSSCSCKTMVRNVSKM